jgi:hypothetical protein
MGLPVVPSPPVLPGTDCWYCTPVPWPAGTTPANLRAIFHGIIETPPYPHAPNDVPIIINQDLISPCFFWGQLINTEGTWEVQLDFSTGRLRLTLGPPFNAIAFDHTYTTCYFGPYTNQATWPLNGYQSGTAFILDYVPPEVKLVAETYNFQPDQTTLYDAIDSATPGHKTIRLTGRKSPGSVLIELDPGAV